MWRPLTRRLCSTLRIFPPMSFSLPEMWLEEAVRIASSNGSGWPLLRLFSSTLYTRTLNVLYWGICESSLLGAGREDIPRAVAGVSAGDHHSLGSLTCPRNP